MKISQVCALALLGVTSLWSNAWGDGPDGKVALQWGTNTATRITVADDGGLDTSDNNSRGSLMNLSTVRDVDIDGGDYTNYLVVDTTNTNDYMPVHQSGMHFKTANDFIAFALSKLHAEPVVDPSNGVVVGVQWVSFHMGTPVYIAADGSIRNVDDFLAVLIGGVEKKLYIGSSSYPLYGTTGGGLGLASNSSTDSTQGVSPMVAGSPADIDLCNSNSTNCIHGSSFNTHALVYDHVGATTSQTVGGFQTSHVGCLKAGFIPWVCTVTTGSNTLQAIGTFFFAPSGTPANTAVSWNRIIQKQSNMPSVTADMTSIVFGFGSGNIPVSRPPGSTVSATTGVCGSHTNFFGLGGNTATGRVSQNCQ
jgi:hypothetical protein